MGTLSPPPSLVVFIINLVLYLLLIGLSTSVLKQNLGRLSTVPRFILVASILRIAWFAAEFAGWGEAAECKDPKGFSSFAGRLSTVLYFSAFLSVLFFWWDSLREGFPEEARCRYCEPRMLDILLKFWVLVLMVGLYAYKFFECDEKNRDRVSKIEITAMSFTFALLAIGFASVGNGLRIQLSYRESVSASQLSFRITTITIVCVILFLTRFFLFMLYPLFEIKIKGTYQEFLYPWLFYTIPEIVPCSILLLTLLKRKKVSVAMEDALLVAPVTGARPEENSLYIFRV